MSPSAEGEISERYASFIHTPECRHIKPYRMAHFSDLTVSALVDGNGKYGTALCCFQNVNLCRSGFFAVYNNSAFKKLYCIGFCLLSGIDANDRLGVCTYNRTVF